MDAVSDRAIRGEGTPDSAWEPWLAQQGIRRIAFDELCPPSSRLVVLAPHPDDEVLACGGLLAMRGAAGLACLVVAVSDGEASHGSHDEEACKRMATRRIQESGAGLRALGLQAPQVVRLGIPDGRVATAVELIAAKLALRLKPSDVLVVTWCRDGHPDHEATATAARRAASAAGCRLLQAPVWMWHWAGPADRRVPWGDMLAVDLPAPAHQAKQSALQCHQSQLEDRGAGQGPVLLPSIVARAARTCEYFFLEQAAHD